MDFATRIEAELGALRARDCLRALPRAPEGLADLSGNDYLGLLADDALREAFFAQLTPGERRLGAAGSRLLGGNSPEAEALEADLAAAYGAEAALFFGSGYHANTAIVPALAGPDTLILADRLCHASMVDGIRASGRRFFRYRHNDLAHARRLLERHAGGHGEVIVMTESVFSMDGDRADLPALVALKRDFPNVVLCLDEAHGVGVFGETGLGCAHEAGLHGAIDLLVGTCGKAWGSLGAYVVCRRAVRDLLVNRARPFIFTTALPPISLAWTRFVLHAFPKMAERRRRVRAMGRRLAEAIRASGRPCGSESQIVPFMVGSNAEAAAEAARFRAAGFHALPIRPPTVPEGTARLRLSLSAALPDDAFGRLLELVDG